MPALNVKDEAETKLGMAPSIKVKYFPVQGLGEVIRLLLAYGDLDFEDIRIPQDKWPELKSGTPFGQLPLYEEDGKVSDQSIAIARYVAKKVKLVGKTDWENLEIDAIVDTITDLRTKGSSALRQSDEEKKKAQLAEVKNETLPFYFTRLEKIIKKNNGYLAAGKLTWADVLFFSLAYSFKFWFGEDVFAPYPLINAHIEKIQAIPRIKKWVETRPKDSH